MGAACDPTLLFLHESFVNFTEVLTTEEKCWESCKGKLQELQKHWMEKGLYGESALHTITQYRTQINWQDMPPDQFAKFYRFVFYICRDLGKRNVQMAVAVAAWRLLLPGRFRLLDRWCAFTAAATARVVTEDTWRQVLDFSRSVHEDLSNYDAAGAWATLLDEFVDDLRASRRRGGGGGGGGGGAMAAEGPGSGGCGADGLDRLGSGPDLAALYSSGSLGGRGGGGGGCGGLLECPPGGWPLLAALSPRAGSKRREPDVDGVAAQLSAIPLGGGGAGPQHMMQHHPYHPHAHGLPPVPPHDAPYTGQGAPYGGSGGGGRGGSPDAAAKRVCLERPLLLAQHAMQLHHLHLQQHPHALADGGLPCLGGGGAPSGTPSAAAAMSVSMSLGGSADSDGAAAASTGRCGGGSVSSEAAAAAGPAGSAAMDYLQDAGGHAVLGPGLHAALHAQHARRSVKARRSGVSDIVRGCVADALGLGGGT